MTRLIAITVFFLSIAASAHAMTPAPITLPESDSVITQVAVGCGVGRTRVNGVCVARTTVRQTRRAVRRCVRWQAGVCALYQ
jgi:cobalamin-dependent methionine synthase I